MKSESIKAIKKRFRREWLLIKVEKADEATTTPISGRLIAHSPHRDEVYRVLFRRPRMKKVLVEFSEDSFPKGYVAGF